MLIYVLDNRFRLSGNPSYELVISWCDLGTRHGFYTVVAGRLGRLLYQLAFQPLGFSPLGCESRVKTLTRIVL